MTHPGIQSLALLGVAVLAAPAGAQSVFDSSIRGSPQYVRYEIHEPSNLTIAEQAVPIYVLVPLASAVNLDVGTAFATAHVDRPANGGHETSDISGLTDTQVRLTSTFGTDFLVLTAGVNVPTGRATAAPAEVLAAGLIGSEFLTFPVTNMGTGLGGTGGVALATQAAGWNVGLGVSMRHSMPYEPFDGSPSSPSLRFQPGDEYRGRVGADHPIGTGRVSFGFTYSRLANDQMGASIYNTGNRYLGQLAFGNAVGFGDLAISAWSLYRSAGTAVDASTLGAENITNASVSYGMHILGGVVEPSAEARIWMQAGLPRSNMAIGGLRILWAARRFAIMPGAAYSMGRLGTQTSSGAAATPKIDGFRASLTIRLGGH